MNIRGTLTVMLLLLLPAPLTAQPLPGSEVVTLLNSGGYVIIVRHGATHAGQADTDPLNLDNAAKQRQLNDKGRADARGLGELFRNAGVVTHRPDLMDALGRDWFDVREGETVFKPDGAGTYTLVGRVPIDRWSPTM